MLNDSGATRPAAAIHAINPFGLTFSENSLANGVWTAHVRAVLQVFGQAQAGAMFAQFHTGGFFIVQQDHSDECSTPTWEERARRVSS